MTVCAVYARYSSDRQSPTSITDQVRKCREYAERHGWTVADEYVFSDEAMSGAGMDRPGLQELLDLATGSRPPFAIVLVDDSSRLSRDHADAARIVQRIRYAGVRAIMCSQNIDTASDQSDVLMMVHSMVDSLYVKELAVKTHRGQEGQVLRGFHAGGRCFGYRAEVVEGGTRLVIDEAEAAIVRRIFEMSAEGMSLKGIAKQLNAEGVRSPRPRKGRTMATWCPGAIRAMLRNERYAGRVVWNRAKFIKRPGTNKRTSRPRPRNEWKFSDHPELRIVSEDLWNRVRDRLAKVKQLYSREGSGNRGLFNRAVTSPYLLTGFLKCGKCESNMVVVTGRGRQGHPRYGCPQAYLRGACSNRLLIRRDHVEQQWFAGIQRDVYDREVLDHIFQGFVRALRESKAARKAEAARLEKRRAELQEELSRLIAAIVDAGHSQFLLDAIAARERELAELSARAAAPATRRAAGEDLVYLRKWTEQRVGDLQSLANENLQRARAELARHASAVRLIPREEAGKRFYVAEGEWDLLGGAPVCAGQFAGEGFEPSTFGL